MNDDTRSASTLNTYATAAERQEAARDAYRTSLATGAPLTGKALGEMFDREARWGNYRIAEVRTEAATRTNGHDSAVSTAQTMSTEAVVEPNANLAGTASRAPVQDVPPIVRRITTTAVLAVAAVAAAVSYDHQRLLAEMAGEGWRAWALPISVDGLLVAASMSMLVRRRAGLSAGTLAWLALLLGGAASVAANVAAAEPTLVGRMVAAWSPIALLISYELLLQQVRTPHRAPLSS